VYQNESGGIPEYIVDLKYDELKKYHEDFYHPCNSKLISYGNLDPLEHQEFIHENYLKDFYKKDIN